MPRSPAKSRATLWVVGMPLAEDQSVSEAAARILREADLCIGEHRTVTSRFLNSAGVEHPPETFFLDPLKEPERRALEERLREIARTGGQVALFSDTGMPVLFDPGAEILQMCRRLGFEVRSAPAATSWGAACALSGYSPPFLLLGFPPRKREERERRLRELRGERAHCVLMDTPYRFELLLQQLTEAVGPDREAFLAWQIATSAERLLWGTLRSLKRTAREEGLTKGEFVLILAGHTGSHREKPPKR